MFQYISGYILPIKSQFFVYVEADLTSQNRIKMSCENPYAFKRLLVLISMIVALIGLALDVPVFLNIRGYSTDKFCCGFDNPMISCNINGMKTYGMEYDNNRTCIVNGNTCDIYRIDNTSDSISLESCIQSFSGSITIGDICNINRSDLTWDLSQPSWEVFFYIAMGGLAITFIADLLELFYINSDMCMRSLAYFLCWYVNIYIRKHILFGNDF